MKVLFKSQYFHAKYRDGIDRKWHHDGVPVVFDCSGTGENRVVFMKDI
jgi:hypothetical protein